MSDSLSQYVLEQLQHDPDGSYTQSFLAADVLGTAIDALFYGQLTTEQTAEQIAARIQQPPNVVKHWISDHDGDVPLCRYVDIAMACGMVPLITLVPIEQAKQAVIQRLTGDQKR